MKKHELPTSEWEHSHAIEAGDELTDTSSDTPMTVDAVHQDGAVTTRIWVRERHGEEYNTVTFDEREVAVALGMGMFERTDGLSEELSACSPD